MKIEWRYDENANVEFMFEGKWCSLHTTWTQPDDGKNKRFRQARMEFLAYLKQATGE